MPRITIDLDTDNAAFHDDEGNYAPGPELSRILGNLADVREYGPVGGKVLLFDINGHAVGSFTHHDDTQDA